MFEVHRSFHKRKESCEKETSATNTSDLWTRHTRITGARCLATLLSACSRKRATSHAFKSSFLGKLLSNARGVSRQLSTTNALRNLQVGAVIITGGLGALGDTVAAWLLFESITSGATLTGRGGRRKRQPSAVVDASFVICCVRSDSAHTSESCAAVDANSAINGRNPTMSTIHASGQLEDALIKRQIPARLFAGSASKHVKCLPGRCNRSLAISPVSLSSVFFECHSSYG